MFGTNVSMKDYEGVQGFGIGSQGDVDYLNKALSAGVARPPVSGGDTLRVESLEATLRTVIYTSQMIKLTQKIPRIPAFSTVEEYNLLSGYGDDAGAFTAEGDLPETQDSTYARKAAFVKFLGTTREVTHPMTLVRPAHGNVIALETQNGAIWLTERLERGLFEARSDLVAHEFDGLKKQILDGAGCTDPWGTYPTAHNIFDARGAGLTEDMVENMAQSVTDGYGVPTDLYGAPKAFSELAKAFFPRERVNLPAPTDGKVGFAITSVVTSAGTVQLNPDIFIRPGRAYGDKTPPAAATSAKAPNAPSAVTGAATADVALSKFGTGENGAYRYFVTAINRYGESLPCATTVAQTAVAVGDKVTLTITDGGYGAGAAPTTAFKIYRSSKDGAVATAKHCFTFPRTAGATTVAIDRNFWLPGCSTGYMIQSNLQYFSLRQLAPLMKIPLATVAASIRWMMLLYCVPIIYSPLKSALVLNVRDDT